MFLSISMIACQTCFIFQEYTRGLRIELIERKKPDLFSLTGCKNLPTVTDHTLFSIWLRDLIPLISFSGDSSHDNRRWVKIPTFTSWSVLTWKCETDRDIAPYIISIMSRKWRDAPRDDFPSLSFPLYVFTVLWHRVNWEIAHSKNTTSLQWYRTVSALWARLPSFWSSLTLYFQFSKCTRSTS